MKCPSVTFVSTALPRLCGIATFTNHIASAFSGLCGIPLGQNPKARIVALHNPTETLHYRPEVEFIIRQTQRKDYIEAAEFLNISQTDVVCLQHEFGIFGGDDGRYVLDLLENLRKPVVTTFHTILQNPSPGQHDVLKRVCELSSYVIVIADKAKQMLKDVYQVPPEKICHIYHGVPDVPFMDPNFYKDQFNLEGKKVLLTFGLIGPGKGIEHAIDAVALVAKKYPQLVYVILGATHPEVKRQTGESYRLGLQQRADEKGIADKVIFFDRFVSDEQLSEFLLMADYYITPYPHKEQISSGTLSFALGCGKAIVSTPYWYAEEILAEGRGILADFNNPEAMAKGLERFLSSEVEYTQVRKRAYQFGRKMVWREIAHQYVKTFQNAAEAGVPTRVERKPLPMTIPELTLDHLHRMTDDTGLYQHCIYSVPWREHGYTTDDNARALRFTMRHYAQYKDESVLPLIYVYLSFLQDSFNPKKGRFRNYLGYDRNWIDDAGSEDCQGRTLAALADTLVITHSQSVAGLAKELFDNAIGELASFKSPRAWAWVIAATDRYLKKFGGAREVRELRDKMSLRLIKAFEDHATDDWFWCEDYLTYDNARLSKALILAGAVTDHGEKVALGIRSLEWLIKIQTDPETGHLTIVGNEGWMKKSGERAQFDQQPLEAAALLSACHEAYKTTKDKRWLAEMRKCFNWFLGANDLNAPLYNFNTHGCHDGLQANGVSQNQGAESTLSWLGALLRMNEEGL
jgi:glycosyltransferase involved in cell wall biosynthesis